MNIQDHNLPQQNQEDKYDPQIIASYVNKQVGISRTSLNVKALIGLFIFGWLMKMNYDSLGEKRFGWIFLLSMVFCLVIGERSWPMFVIGFVIYVAAWIHTNSLLTNKQQIAREQFFKEHSKV